jgi:hypothetical protein
MLVGLLGLLYRRLWRRYRPSVWRTRADAAYSAAVACMLAVIFMQVFMVRPSLGRASNWGLGQHARFAASASDLHVLQATANRVYGDQHPLFLVTEVLLGAWVPSTLTGVLCLTLGSAVHTTSRETCGVREWRSTRRARQAPTICSSRRTPAGARGQSRQRVCVFGSRHAPGAVSRIQAQPARKHIPTPYLHTLAGGTDKGENAIMEAYLLNPARMLMTPVRVPDVWPLGSCEPCEPCEQCEQKECWV